MDEAEEIPYMFDEDSPYPNFTIGKYIFIKIADHWCLSVEPCVELDDTMICQLRVCDSFEQAFNLVIDLIYDRRISVWRDHMAGRMSSKCNVIRDLQRESSDLIGPDILEALEKYTTRISQYRQGLLDSEFSVTRQTVLNDCRHAIDRIKRTFPDLHGFLDDLYQENNNAV